MFQQLLLAVLLPTIVLSLPGKRKAFEMSTSTTSSLPTVIPEPVLSEPVAKKLKVKEEYDAPAPALSEPVAKKLKVEEEYDAPAPMLRAPKSRKYASMGTLSLPVFHPRGYASKDEASAARIFTGWSNNGAMETSSLPTANTEPVLSEPVMRCTVGEIMDILSRQSFAPARPTADFQATSAGLSLYCVGPSFTISDARALLAINDATVITVDVVEAAFKIADTSEGISPYARFQIREARSLLLRSLE
jgi:hypothetical protein